MTTVRDVDGIHRNSVRALVEPVPARDAPVFDEDEAVRAATALLRSLGVALDGEHRRGTPRRMVLALHEMLTAPSFEPTSFENAEGYDEFVTMRAIPFFSLCEHHVLPFIGTATIAYIPGERIVGLSKLARVIQVFARRLQVQERMTTQIADWLVERLEPRGVGVHLRAEHLCMSLRGARAAGAVTTTTARRGVVAHNQVRGREWDRLVSTLNE